MIRPHQKSPDYGKRDEFVELAAAREAFFSEAAKKLGFEDPFNREHRYAFMEGRYPNTEYKLGRHRANANDTLFCNTVAPGEEFTNLLPFLNKEGKEALAACMRWAMEDVIAHAEKMAEIRRGAAGANKEPGGLISLGVVHERNNNDEPFLHGELLFSRYGVAKSDESIHSLDNPVKLFYQKAEKLEETFQLSFGNHVEEYMKIRCDLENGKARIAAIDPIHRESRSTRGEQIQRSLKANGKEDTPENRDRAALFTRGTGSKKPAEELHKEWLHKVKSDRIPSPRTEKSRGLFKVLWEDHAKEIAKTAKEAGLKWWFRHNDIIRVRDVDRFIKETSKDNQRGYREARKNLRASKTTSPIGMAYEATRDFLRHRGPEFKLGKRDRVVIASSVALSYQQFKNLQKIADRGVNIQWKGVAMDNHRIAKSTQMPRADSRDENRSRRFS